MNYKGIEEFNGAKVSVLGLARSGIAVSKLLAKYNAKVLASDIKPLEELPAQIKELEELNIIIETGGHSKKIYDADYIIVSPGIPPFAPIIKEIQKRNIPILSEIEVAYRLSKAPIIAITGTNGKTTVTTLIGKMLEAGGLEVLVAGNIGYALCERIDEISSNGYIIAEISSFQLKYITHFHPFISVLLNITPDHLNWHKDMKDYVDSKLRIFENMQADDIIVHNLDDYGINKWWQPTNIEASLVDFSTQKQLEYGVWVRDDGKIIARSKNTYWEVCNKDELKIVGNHNLSNACAATSIGLILGLDIGSINKTLLSFKGVEHRLEWIRQIDNIDFYNDSKATNLPSLRVALKSFPKRKIILIAGGSEKEEDYSTLPDYLRNTVRHTILIGNTRKHLMKIIGDTVPVSDAGYSLEYALKLAIESAKSNDVILLSPGCASFDMFDNYEHRGEYFKRLVLNI